MSTRPQEHEAGGKVESILAAAKRSFLARGFEAVSMDAIAREAGVSKATVYAHFSGKEELFGAVIGRAGPERNLAQIEAFMRRAGAAGALAIADTRLAAEQFIGLVRGETQLRQLLRLEPAADTAAIEAAVKAAVATFLRAFRPARR